MDEEKIPVRFDQVRFAWKGEPIEEGALQLLLLKWRHRSEYEKRLREVSVLRVEAEE